MDGELKKIKKLYGENFAKLCRELFPEILENQGELSEVLENNFAPSRCLYDDIIEQDEKENFQCYINKLIKQKNNIQVEEEIEVKQTPEQLLAKAGYDLFKCETHEDVLKFKKYYLKEEELCTFRDAGRTLTHHVFFAVKKNALEIKRENFKEAKRQDEYGTSVISIQFKKGNNALSIKNRYNHSVRNCDATFSNNLNFIVKGLKQSFEKFYSLKYIDREFVLSNYMVDKTGKLYPMNHIFTMHDFAFGPNNMLMLKNEIQIRDKSKFEIFDYFILDKQKNELTCAINDPFVNEFNNVQKIDIIRNKENNTREFYVYNKDGTNFKFVLDSKSRIIEYYNSNIKELDDNFLYRCKKIKTFHAPNVIKIGNNCLSLAEDLYNLQIPNVEIIGKKFIQYNRELVYFIVPKLKSLGDYFLAFNHTLKTINVPNLTDYKKNILFNHAYRDDFIAQIEENIKRKQDMQIENLVEIKTQ